MNMFDFEEESLTDPTVLADYLKAQEKKCSENPEHQTENSTPIYPQEDFDQKVQANCNNTTSKVVAIEFFLIFIIYFVLFAINDILILFAIMATPIIIAIFNIILGMIWFQYRDYNTQKVKGLFYFHLMAIILTVVVGWNLLSNWNWM